LPPLAAEGESHTRGLSSSSGEVHHQDHLHLEHGLVSVRPIRLGYGDHLLTGELVSPLRHIALDVDLLSAGSCSLPLPKGVPLLKRQPGVWPGGMVHGGTVIMV
jgi:hypothetical protein